MKRRFTQAEVYYLNTLPAVERASMDRITYSRDFQVRCMAQYLRGNGPTSIFASAGLNPKIVGSKRIERAIARWKADPQIMLEAQSFANEAAADQRDLLVISQSMTIAWLEKKVMDLQKQIQSVKRMRRNVRPCRPTGRSSDWNSVQKRSHDRCASWYGDAPNAIPPSIVSAFSVTFTRLPDGRRDSFRLWPHTPRLAHAAKDAIRSIFVRYAAPMGRPYGTASACTRSVPRFRWLSPSPA